MPDDRFKKYQEAGVDFLETARARAEEFLRELSKAGESTQRQGRDTLDDLLEGSRKGTEQMRKGTGQMRKGTEQMLDSIRKEVRAQLSLLGLATKEDLAALERRLRGGAPAKATAARKSPASKTTAKKAGAAKSGARKSTAAKKSTSAAKTSGSKTPAKRSTAAKKATGSA